MNQPKRKPTGIFTVALAVLASFCSPLGAQEIQVFGFTSEWKYEPSGTNPPSSWMSLDYDDSDWPAGRGAFSAFSTEYLLGLAPINSGVAIYNPYPIPGNLPTHYFRTRFSFPYPRTNVYLVASNLIDDGAVFYLNGIELARIAMPTGAVDHTTVATRDNEVSSRGAEIIRFDPPAHLQEENLIAVEVHQGSSFSMDTVFAMSLSARFPLAITILSHPKSQALWESSNVVFRVEATGFPMFYQWQQDATNIPGATASTYDIPRVAARHEGSYRVIITNEYESVTSRVAVLTVFTDREGPQILAAIGDNRQPSGSGTFGSHTINVLFDEPVSNSVASAGAQNPNNYTVTRLGATNAVPVLRVLYSTALGALLIMDATDPDWLPGSEYVLTVNHVRDTRGNAVAPDSQIAVAWLRTTNISLAESIWSFHTSAVFDPGVYDLPWQSTNFIEGPWWAQGQGLFCGGPVLLTPCFGAFRTETGFQPEPSLFRTTFVWPTNWPPVTTLNVSTIFDDGLVLYLNGVEIWRGNMPASVTAFTRANAAASTCHTNLSIAVTNLFPGTNWLAAAVAQSIVASEGDSVFGLNHVGAIAPFAAPLPESPPPALNVSPLGTNSLQLSWTGHGYALESTTNLNLGAVSYSLGPWRQVPNMSNPYTNRLDEPHRFFRLKK